MNVPVWSLPGCLLGFIAHIQGTSTWSLVCQGVWILLNGYHPINFTNTNRMFACIPCFFTDNNFAREHILILQPNSIYHHHHHQLGAWDLDRFPTESSECRLIACQSIQSGCLFGLVWLTLINMHTQFVIGKGWIGPIRWFDQDVVHRTRIRAIHPLNPFSVSQLKSSWSAVLQTQASVFGVCFLVL